MAEIDVNKVINFDGFDAHNGIRVVDCRDGEAEVEVTLSKDSLNIWHIPHGGLLFAIADVAAGAAATAGRDIGVVTLTSNLNFLRSGGCEGKLHAYAHERKIGKSAGFYDVEIKDDGGRLLCTASFVMHVTAARMESARRAAEGVK